MGIDVIFAEYPEIKNVNVRKEGNGDDAPLAVDVKVKGLVAQKKEELISKLTGCITEQAKSFWNLSDESVFPAIEEICIPTNFDEGQHAKLGNVEYRNIRVRGVSFKPLTKGLRITFTIQIPNIDHEKIGDLAELIKRRVECELFADPELFDQ